MLQCRSTTNKEYFIMRYVPMSLNKQLSEKFIGFRCGYLEVKIPAHNSPTLVRLDEIETIISKLETIKNNLATIRIRQLMALVTNVFYKIDRDGYICRLELDGYQNFNISEGLCDNGLAYSNEAKHMVRNINCAWADLNGNVGVDMLYPVDGENEFNRNLKNFRLWSNPKRIEYLDFVLRCLKFFQLSINRLEDSK